MWGTGTGRAGDHSVGHGLLAVEAGMGKWQWLLVFQFSAVEMFSKIFKIYF